MSHNDTLLALTKANAQLQVNITQLLQKSSQGWLEAMQHFSSAGLAETDAQAEELLGAGDWAALMALPSAMLSRSSPAWAGGPQALTQLAIREQILFTNGLRRALLAWQQAVAEALDGDAHAQPFIDIMRQWAPPWTDNAKATQDKE